MADVEDKEKAEKVAAARKRFEQIKKQKAKKAAPAKKAAGDDTTTATSTADSDAAPAAPEAPSQSNEESVEDVVDTTTTTDTAATAVDQDPEDDDIAVPANDDTSDNPAAPRQPSLSLQSQMRSESFKRTNNTMGVVSPGATGIKSPPLPPLSTDGNSVQDIYSKQAARIEALEAENKRLEKDTVDLESSRTKIEKELEDLRESQADVVAGSTASSKSPGEVQKLRAEVTSLQRQLAQQAKDKRRSSGVTPVSPSADDLSSQLNTKTSTIESLELEMSKLRLSLSESESSNVGLKSRVNELETSLKSAEQSSEMATHDLASLRASLSPSTTSSEEAKDQATRIALLTSDLHSAQRQVTDAQNRATNLEKKIETLTSLHRESESRQQSQISSRSKEMDRLRTENTEMRKKISSVSNENARLREHRARSESYSSTNRPGTSSSAGGGDMESNATSTGGSDEGASKKLQARIRALEAENSDLRRGVWRDKRRELQQDMLAEGDAEDDEIYLGPGSPNGAIGTGFDDVDLSPPGPYRRKSSPYTAFGFTNIINTFTGRDPASYNAVTSPGGYFGSSAGGTYPPRGSSARQHSQQHVPQRPSGDLNELKDDQIFSSADRDLTAAADSEADFGAFDEDAFRAAQEEQAKARLERVRQVKRGLNDWKGWKLDIVSLRGAELAGVFDV